MDAYDRPGAPKAELCRDLSEDKRGTHTTASRRAPTSRLPRRRHQNPRLRRTQMQRIRERQRDTEMPSGRRRSRDSGHNVLPPVLRIRHCFRDRTGTNCLSGLGKSSLTHHLYEYTHWQLVTGIRAYRQKHLRVKGSLNNFRLSCFVLFFICKIFVCFPRKMGLMNQHQLENNYLNTLCQSSVLFFFLSFKSE